MASETDGNITRGPVWKMAGSSASMRNWLNVNPAGPMSGTSVERRKIRSAISSMRVSMVVSPSEG